MAAAEHDDGTRVLVVTTDRVGHGMAGPAIRAWELARLLQVDHDVVLASPYPVEQPTVGFRAAVAGDRGALEPLVRSCDVVIGIAGCVHHHAWIGELDDVAVVVDAYDPTALEALERYAGGPADDAEAAYADALAQMVEPLRWADLVLCASTRQRDLLVGILLALGRINPDTYASDPTLASMLAVVPFGLPAEPPEAPDPGPLRGPDGVAGPDDVVLLWAGGIYDWLDPLTLIDAVARLDDRHKAVFLGVTHPTPAVGAMPMAARARRRSDELGLTDRRVFFNDGWVPYDQRAGWLLDADIGVSLHGDHLETAYAFRTRMLDYLWTALPILCTDGDALADLVRAEGLGAVVPPGDPDAVAEAVRVMDDPARRADHRAALADEAGRRTWPEVAAPLLRWCERPRRAADRCAGPARPTPPWLHAGGPTPDAPATPRRVRDVAVSTARRAAGRATRPLRGAGA